jgi:hypothetical protein
MNNFAKDINSAIVFQDQKISECLMLDVLAPEQLFRHYESMGEVAKLDFVAACISRICLQNAMLKSMRGGPHG